MLLSNPFRGAFGLDIGDLSIKLVQLERRPSVGRQARFRLREMRSVSLPPGLIVNGEIQQPELVRKKILHLLGRDGSIQKSIRSNWVVADLPEPRSFLKLITIDTPAPDLIFEDIVYHAKKHVPFEIEDTYLDWQLLNGESFSSKASNVLIAAVPKVVADSYTYLFEACGLGVLALEGEALSISRALITRDKDYTGEARALLDLGATRSSLIVYDKQSIRFSTNIRFSGEMLTVAIAQGLKLEYADAEKLKLSQGLAYSPDAPRYIAIVAERINEFVNELKQALQFYKEHFSDSNPVTHITLCGGAARLSGLTTVVTERLHITAGPGNAWKNVSLKHLTGAAQQEGLVYASAIGLALRAAEHPLPA